MQAIYIAYGALLLVALIKQFFETMYEEKLRIEYEQQPLPTSAYVLMLVRYLVRFLAVFILHGWDPLAMPESSWHLFFILMAVGLGVEFLSFLAEVIVRFFTTTLKARKNRQQPPNTENIDEYDWRG